MKKLSFLIATLFSQSLWATPSNLPLTQTEAYGTSLARTTTYTWDSTLRIPTSVTVPVSDINAVGGIGSRVINYTYVSGTSNPSLISITAPSNISGGGNLTRNYNMTYDSNGQLLTLTGPRYVSGSVNEKLTFTYSSGKLATITNGLGQVVTYSNYNSYGSPQTIVDENGMNYTLNYDSRNRLISVVFQGNSSTPSSQYETTTYTRDNVGQVTKITSPRGYYKTMVYDSAHRLTQINEYDESANYLGKIAFTLDNMSNLTQIDMYDAGGTKIRTSSAQYDSQNRLHKTLDSLNHAYTYTLDGNGNVTNINDPNNKNVTMTIDALNRVTSTTLQDSGVINTVYDIADRLSKVTDPKLLDTNYTYNGFDDLIKQVSPDTGTSIITRDLDGNALTYTDARGQVSTMTYDVLNRLTSISYTGHSSENVTITYDSCSNGVGKICSMTDMSGTTNYTYNNKGYLSSKQYVNGTFSKTVSYGYDNYGQLNSMTYPSGKVINYSYTNGKISAISYTNSGTTTTIASSITYQPFNSDLSTLTWGNSATMSQSFTLDGMIGSVTATNAYPVNKSYSFDSRLNITGITETGSTARSSTATYDDKSRITNYTYGTTGNNYTYNTSDDRINQTTNSGTATTYNYPLTSHLLSSLSGGSTDSMTYDNNGNILTASGVTYTYNSANRMLTSTSSSLTTNYLINFLGQRTKKSNSTATTWFIYDENDNIIAEYDGSGNVQNEYVYLDNRPVGLIRSSALYYIYTDHLQTPRAITDTSNNLKWTWENKESFGNSLPNETISGSTFKFNMRFSGQYFDNETNLNYNLHRDYNPVWGRYIESDPLGLSAGISTYIYVGGNSLGWKDKEGFLETNMFVRTIVGLGDISTLGISYYIRKKFNIGEDYYNKNGWSNASDSEIECFIKQYGNNPIDRNVPQYMKNASFAYAEHYSFAKDFTKRTHGLSILFLTPAIIGYSGYKITMPFAQDENTSPPSFTDFSYSFKGIKDGLFEKNN